MNSYVGILCGTITNTSQLDSSKFNISRCLLIVGSYFNGTVWTLHSIGNSDSGGSAIVYCAGKYKTNYLCFSWTTTSLQVFTGDGISNGSLTNATSNNGVMLYSNNTNAFEWMAGIRCNEFFVHCWNDSQFSMIGVALTSDYDKFSREGSFKLLALDTGSTPVFKLYIVNRYNPYRNVHEGNVVLTEAYSISNARLTAIGRSCTQGETAAFLVPLLYNDLSIGWQGGNVSAIAKVYLCDYFTNATFGTPPQKIVISSPTNSEICFVADF